MTGLGRRLRRWLFSVEKFMGRGGTQAFGTGLALPHRRVAADRIGTGLDVHQDVCDPVQLLPHGESDGGGLDSLRSLAVPAG